MFSRRLPLTHLIDLCRVLRHQLSAGLSLHQVMKQQGQRGPRSVRALAGDLAEALQKGSSLSDALDEKKDLFPPLFLSLVRLGESTGHMAEIFGELERYYQLELQLRRQFRSQTFLPILQFFLAILVFAGLIYILGVIAASTGGKPLITFLGLSGGAGALAFLGLVLGTLAIAWGLASLLTRFGRQKAWVDRLVLRVPALGSCVRALVMSRFALALQLTLDTGLSITRALQLGLSATGNAYFASRADMVVLALKNGETLHAALASSGLFADDFLDMVASAEVSGKLPEMMRHLAQQYHEEATRRMTLLTMVAGMAVWGGYALFAIWLIFRIASVYLGALGGV
jgi:type IV pilus assembly protein PilC